VALLAGKLKVGVAGKASGAVVVKLRAADQALVPTELVALTLQ
jgi:hypothetical protein